MAQQMIYKGTSDGYRIVAMSDGLRGKGFTKTLTSLSKLPNGRIGLSKIYSRTDLEGGTVLMSTVIDSNGTRNHHISHFYFVPAEQKAQFSAGIMPFDRFASTYPDNHGVSELPEAFPDASWNEAVDLQAARTLFAGQSDLLSLFLAGLDDLTNPFMTRTLKGICVLASGTQEAVSEAAYRLMETLGRLVPEWGAIGYRSLWNGADNVAQFPVFFTTNETLSSPDSPLSNACALFSVSAGKVEFRRGETPPRTRETDVLANELLSGSPATARWAARQLCDAKEQARRRAEEERRAREEAARQEALRRQAEEEEARRREAARKAELEQKAREEAARRIEAEKRAREEAARKAEAEKKAYLAMLRRAQEESKAREDDIHKARIEAAKKAHEEEERRAREKAEKKAREEAERKAREEAERKALEEAERKALEEAERKAREKAAVSEKLQRQLQEEEQRGAPDARSRFAPKATPAPAMPDDGDDEDAAVAMEEAGGEFFQGTILPMLSEGKAREALDRIRRNNRRISTLRGSDRRSYISGFLDTASTMELRYSRREKSDLCDDIVSSMLCMAQENRALLLSEKYCTVRNRQDPRFATWQHCLETMNGVCRAFGAQTDDAFHWTIMTDVYLGVLRTIPENDVKADLKMIRGRPSMVRANIREAILETAEFCARLIQSRHDPCYWSALTGVFLASARFKKDGGIFYEEQIIASCLKEVNRNVRSDFFDAFRRLTGQFAAF